jgi:hypothetical protein
MDEYRIIYLKDGKKRYLKYTGKKYQFIKTGDVPQEWMDRFEEERIAAAKEAARLEELAKNAKNCIFCKGFGRYQRLVHLQTVYLCEEHYQTMNIGKIAQRMRESGVMVPQQGTA